MKNDSAIGFEAHIRVIDFSNSVIDYMENGIGNCLWCTKEGPLVSCSHGCDFTLCNNHNISKYFVTCSISSCDRVLCLHCSEDAEGKCRDCSVEIAMLMCDE
mgnify:CR=1 FL=1|jgi:hypothetical protein